MASIDEIRKHLDKCNVPELLVDKVKTIKIFITDHCKEMDVDEVEAFVNDEVCKKFDITKTDVKPTLKKSIDVIKGIQDAIEELKNEELNKQKDEDIAPELKEAADIIKQRAREIMLMGDPVQFILDTHQRLHVGDIDTATTLIASIGIQSVLNSEGIHPKVSGSSGKGKTHCCRAMCHLLPPEYVEATSLSDKAIYYMEDMLPGTVIFSDDINLSESMEGVIKRATTNFQTGDTHTTIDADRKLRKMTIKPRLSWWLTSVDDTQSLQLLNRTFGGDVDESKEQDTKVVEFQLQRAATGEEYLPLNDDVCICREIIRDLKNKTFGVVIEYATYISWGDPTNRRNLEIFLDIVKAFAAIRYRQRRLVDDKLFASLDDFDSAADLYAKRAENQGLKLNNLERKIISFIQSAGVTDSNNIQKHTKKSQGRISQVLHGKGLGGDSGLLGKVAALHCDSVNIESDDGKHTMKKEYSFHGDAFQVFDSTVVSIPKDKRDDYYRYYQTINGLLINKNDISLNDINYITNINNNIDTISNECVDSEEDIHTIIPSHENGNNGNNGNNVTADNDLKSNSPINTEVIAEGEDQRTTIRDIQRFVNGHSDQRDNVRNQKYKTIAFDFCQAHRGVHDNLDKIEALINKMAINGSLWQ